jgi:flavin reductase
MTMREHFLEGMSKVAATVSIVTTYSTKGRHGATVSAMSSVSADTPNPTLLICVRETSATAEAIRASGVFCVNVLQNSQAHISDRFARNSQTLDNDKFSCADWTLDALGSPQIVGGLVAFSCILSSWQKVGTHIIIFGDVKDVVIANEGSPLMYLHRLYCSAVPIYGPPRLPST